MEINYKRITVLTVLMLLPATALAAAAASGADGGMMASLLEGMFNCSSGCPNS